MRTSLDIQDELFQAARRRAMEEGTTFRALVERGLAIVLGVERRVEAETDRIARERGALASLQSDLATLPVQCDLSLEELLYDEEGLPA